MKGDERLSEIFDQNPYMAVMYLDKDGIVLFMNKTYLNILGLTQEQVMGRQITDITPQTKSVKALSTGKAITDYNFYVKGKHMIASAVPIFNHERVITGCFVYSLSLNIWDSKTMLEKLITENKMLKDEVFKSHTAKYSFDDMVGTDKSLLDAKLLAQQVAQQPQTRVLITGETGTGKELFAQAIHNASARSMYPFVRVNCAAIPENLLEAELFGYEDGAFTGAKKGGRLGKFELANNGTIFLDEIGEMPLAMQSKLLVVLQEKELERLGGGSSIKLDVRVISATNHNLEDLVKNGLFREDLYYRLNVVQVEVPALRNRKEDLNLLVCNILKRLNSRLNTAVVDISQDACDLLHKHSWPGNVRELENVLERAVSLAHMENTQLLGKRHFAVLCTKSNINYPTGQKSLKTMTQEFEEKIVRRVLEEYGHDKVQAAESLEIDLSSLYRKLKKYGMSTD